MLEDYQVDLINRYANNFFDRYINVNLAMIFYYLYLFEDTILMLRFNLKENN